MESLSLTALTMLLPPLHLQFISLAAWSLLRRDHPMPTTQDPQKQPSCSPPPSRRAWSPAPSFSPGQRCAPLAAHKGRRPASLRRPESASDTCAPIGWRAARRLPDRAPAALAGRRPSPVRRRPAPRWRPSRAGKPHRDPCPSRTLGQAMHLLEAVPIDILYVVKARGTVPYFLRQAQVASCLLQTGKHHSGSVPIELPAAQRIQHMLQPHLHRGQIFQRHLLPSSRTWWHNGMTTFSSSLALAAVSVR
jgi:hypothetical protein